jgi:hypothetical protein
MPTAVADVEEWPQIYDCTLDERRRATQEDIDRMEAIIQCYGALVYLMRGCTEKMTIFTPDAYRQRQFLLGQLSQRMDSLKCRPQPQS